MGRDHIYFSLEVGACLFVLLCVVFDVLRTRLWWVYEPRLHHTAYKPRTPPAPGPGFMRWAVAVMRLLSLIHI